MRPARIGIIGAGWWAVENHIPLLKSNPDCELVAVNRLGADELAQLQARFDIPHGFEDYREMLGAVELDGVIIASPHVLHHEHAIAAIRSGCHVLVEKPLATTASDARDIVAEAKAHGREVIVPYGWNFKDYSDRAAELIVEGRIGRVEHVVLQMASALDDLMAGQPMKETEGAMFRPPASTWADPKRAGGYGWGQLVHALGLLFKIADLDPAEVFAAVGRSPAGVDYYDAAVVRFANGATASLSGASTVPKHRSFQIDLRIFGTEGMLLLDIERERLEVSRRDGTDVIVPMQPGDGAYSCTRPVGLLVDYCLGRTPPNPSPGLVGMRAVEVLDAMYRSAASGRMEKV
ncbi:Gfo/Idh/MocA family oxidoreductase [Kaistia dalseonensis]|uniref:Dehydrogenase n=1 Tax=Kaistia dalseonensis TaxID=410840 RepID=A0ABU0HAX4_9HYPH|nr:Gfo/Idh/MocA family oxidoreductase [Kaistia dalseonensis]MCX5496022.1 Gfo/Idh/MocA family oxidoreductase [Kaistia dalseonensis]MDQ0438626.1 putative dehydrogenase [Kaistia dalseonensis]